MITPRERNLLIMLLVLGVLGAYFLFYLQPTLEERTQLISDIESAREGISDAQLRTIQHSIAVSRLENDLTEEWEETMVGIGEYISVTEMYRLVQRIVYQHAAIGEQRDVSVDIGESEQEGNLYITPVSVSFNASVPGLEAVVRGFNTATINGQAIENRIVSYNVTANFSGNFADPDVVSVNLTVEFITQRGH